ncbi:hypothetical protein BDY21DRAFT_383370 [Lineolata rhizophorae]|uniref:Ca2+-modulated nonselective cation channel polycystin n=1 Tax=Lineolata rhizophorae TaxID=578093 RepID=A0A6A6PB92_9PEZI|nr:hypothetical protein BDY21DRAFT_383370 [Lineolata rhizophorae]
MATAEHATRPVDRHTRRRPFASWMKRLTNLKNSSSDSPNTNGKKQNIAINAKSKKTGPAAPRNNPYPESGHLHRPAPTSSVNGHLSFSTRDNSRRSESYTSLESSSAATGAASGAPLRSNRSAAPTVATNPETIHSDAGQSKAGTSNTAGNGANSVFSSPNHSDRSLTTTLTTIQSTAPSAMLGHAHGTQTNAAGALNTPSTASAPSGSAPNTAHHTSIQFSHQFPVSPGQPPPSAIPPHLSPHPHTYTAATANNLLTDNASILTLASSSKRRRRHSLDTDASVRAIAPSSVWGGSRESLPLSVLSGAGPADPATVYSPPGRPSIGGSASISGVGVGGSALASTERNSVYSASGAGGVPGLSSDRNSYYANKTIDGGSVRSGLLGHGRNDSISNSIGGVQTGGPAASSPLASPKETRHEDENATEKEGEAQNEGQEKTEGGAKD